MQEIWAQTNPGGAAVEDVLRFVTERAGKFDRQIRRRNVVEWIGGVVGTAGVAYFLNMTESAVEMAFGLSMGAFMIAVCVFLWLKGRVDGAADPALSRPLYRAALERKYAKQVELLQGVKFWFLLPILATGGVTARTYLAGEPGKMDWFYLPLILVGFSLTIYLNDVVAVGQVREEWDRVRRALDDGDVE